MLILMHQEVALLVSPALASLVTIYLQSCEMFFFRALISEDNHNSNLTLGHKILGL